MSVRRTVAFIDGFNLYHAIDDLKAHHFKWLNLRALAQAFAPAPDFQLTDVLYFSAYATWLKASFSRHQEYVAALKAVGVQPVLGRFKEKDRRCRRCGNAWKDHEEKETDVNIALRLFEYAMDGRFDTALLLSGDSDLTPAVHLIRRRCPGLEVRILAPPGRPHSMELVRAAGGSGQVKINQSHLERCLLPATVHDANGRTVATRPRAYDPPTGFRFRPVP